MKQLQVYMATGWLPQPELVGMLGYDSIRGNATFRWEYSSAWLQAHRGLTISADLQNAEGPQYGSGLLGQGQEQHARTRYSHGPPTERTLPPTL